MNEKQKREDTKISKRQLSENQPHTKSAARRRRDRVEEGGGGDGEARRR